MATGTLRYWASAKAAAGRQEDLLDAGTLAEALALGLDATRHRQALSTGQADSARLAEIFGIAAYVVDGAPVGARPHATIDLAPGWIAEVLPPFAGG